MKGRAGKVVFTATIAAALAFGGARTVAQPSTVQPAARACNDATCARVCSLLGFRGGFCNTGGGCSCYL